MVIESMRKPAPSSGDSRIEMFFVDILPKSTIPKLIVSGEIVRVCFTKQTVSKETKSLQSVNVNARHPAIEISFCFTITLCTRLSVLHGRRAGLINTLNFDVSVPLMPFQAIDFNPK